MWKTRIGPVWRDEYGGARSTPTIDGDRLYALGTEGDLVCLETATGKVVWQRHLARDFGGHPMVINGTDWKFAESPLVDGERVIVTPGTRAAGLVALEKSSGRELWRAALPELGEKGPRVRGTPRSSSRRPAGCASTFSSSVAVRWASKPRPASSSGATTASPTTSPTSRPRSSTAIRSSSRPATAPARRGSS
ncbi:MAG: PQQ-binding-like beta-propeller repeat protein [Thermoanaerobaculia bacterium]|nr:PQQ-binding-like beta-propeller repeat protein [Thermoanaerobaculia bacterium]